MLAVSVTRWTLGSWQQLEPIDATTNDSKVSSSIRETSDSGSKTALHVGPHATSHGPPPRMSSAYEPKRTKRSPSTDVV